MSEGPGGISITPFVVGPVATNCFVVARGDECWFIDAGYGPDAMIEHARKARLTPAALVLTHAHGDHIAGVAEVRSAFPGLPILIHEAEAAWLADPLLNLSEAIGMPVSAPGPDRTLAGGEELSLGDSRWRVLHTPGHSPGGITLYCEAARAAIVGDALFAGSIGRTDFPGSDHQTLTDSIRRVLYALPDETVIYPGHGPTSTIGREKRTNPFVRG